MGWIGNAIGIVEILLVLAAIIFHKIITGKGTSSRHQISRKADRGATEANSVPVAPFKSVEIIQYRFRDLEDATNNFCDENKLGNGGFGVVYKGILDGQVVAIKKLYGNSVKLLRDVAKEVSLLSSLKNENIVQLLGFCFELGQYLLVYEYIPNKDLHHWLSDETKRQNLDWELRFKIIKGFAKGLCYLHHGSDNTIVHCDLKPANIMLDDHYNAKIADFGLSRVFELDKTHRTTKKIAGTYGYIAPELFFKLHYSTKSDVFSYGQLVLEILVGCTIHQYAKANEQHLSHVVWKQWKDNRPLIEIIDISLQDKCSLDQVTCCILVGLLCVQHNQEKRPNMELVNDMLNGNGSLPAPSFPGYFQVYGVDRGLTFEDSVATQLQYAEFQDANISINLHQVAVKTYSLRDLEIATYNFSRKVWDDSRYVVYKGCLEGRTVGVEEYSVFADGNISNLVRRKKKFKIFSEKHKHSKRDFLLPHMRHPNVVKILGYSLEVEGKLFLVFRYPRHGRLADYLNKRPDNVPALDWSKRRKIALGTARGLSYIHEECNPKVIHRNVKMENIFLDHDFEAVVGCFGYAKLRDDKDTQFATAVEGIVTHTTSEYLLTGRSSEKTDVFHFGIMLLKLISGQHAFDLARLANYDDAMLIAWVKELIKKKRLANLVDPDLQNNFIETEVESLIQVALLCTQASPLQRPWMSEVVRMLEGSSNIDMCDESQNVHLVGRFVFIYADEDPEVHLGQLKQFSFKELQIATDNFSNKNYLGTGGFAKVYKGILVDGTIVAVKRHTTGDESQFQIQLEIASMAVHHNLLRLRGFCVSQTERFLVYPYMANGSVVSYLRERPLNVPPLDWLQRKNIALGAARGLSYFHHHCEYKIIHRNVKASGIFLDEQFEAVVADFGFARLLNYHDMHATASVICGTPGYIDPKYYLTGKISEKIDVYSYGIVLLELVTGLQAYELIRLASDDEVTHVNWVKKHLEERELWKVVDPDLVGNNLIENEVESLIKLALLCTRHFQLERPKMSEVVWMLEGECLAERMEEWQSMRHEHVYELTGNLTANELSSTGSILANELSTGSLESSME